MSVTMEPYAEVPGSTPEPPALSPLQRAVAVFVRPAEAWRGLSSRRQWWFPLLLTAIVSVASFALLYDRAIMPAQQAKIQQQIQDQGAPPEMAERFDRMNHNPLFRAANIGSVLVFVLAFNALLAVLPWLGSGFILGFRLSYRDAFALVAWSSLVLIPEALLKTLLVWTSGSIDQHLSLAVLLPEGTSHFRSGAAFFLDWALGPFWLWWLAVLSIGASALSGAPRKPLMLTLGGLWVSIMLVISALVGAFSPAA